jgi:hypothetical protein
VRRRSYRDAVAAGVEALYEHGDKRATAQRDAKRILREWRRPGTRRKVVILPTVVSPADLKGSPLPHGKLTIAVRLGEPPETPQLRRGRRKKA